MIDKLIQPYFQAPLSYVGKQLLKILHPNTVSLIGLVFGLSMMVSIFFENYLLAFVLLALNRLCDGLDGAMARLSAPSLLGGYIDIVFDFIIYSGFVLAFGLSSSSNTQPAMILLFSYIGTGISFLAYSSTLQNSSIHEERDEKIHKSFYYVSGLIEGFETIVFMVVCLILPQWFYILAYVFAFLCVATTISRVWINYQKFKPEK